jgi:hypothetical protein
MSAAGVSVSSPIWNTVAARAKDACPAVALSVATPTRSHNALMARSLWPCAASQSPKLRSSLAGSAGSTRRSASAAGTKRSRSARRSGV